MAKKTKREKQTDNDATKTRHDPYPYDVFVKNWSKAANVAEVVASTGLSKNTVSAICTKLRKAGVPLKIMPRRVARPIDVKGLSALVKATT